MLGFDDLRLARKLGLLVLVVMICATASSLFIADLLRSELLQSRLEELRALTDTATGIATSLQAQVDSGQLDRDHALEALNAISGISCKTPGGAFYLYVNCGGMIGRTTPQGKRLEGDADVVLYLLEQAGVALVAGSAYGVSPFFRMSIATSIEIIDEGCRKIAAAVAALN